LQAIVRPSSPPAAFGIETINCFSIKNGFK
jgi:hypothetical protein